MWFRRPSDQAWLRSFGGVIMRTFLVLGRSRKREVLAAALRKQGALGARSFVSVIFSLVFLVACSRCDPVSHPKSADLDKLLAAAMKVAVSSQGGVPGLQRLEQGGFREMGRSRTASARTSFLGRGLRQSHGRLFVMIRFRYGD